MLVIVSLLVWVTDWSNTRSPSTYSQFFNFSSLLIAQLYPGLKISCNCDFLPRHCSHAPHPPPLCRQVLRFSWNSAKTWCEMRNRKKSHLMHLKRKRIKGNRLKTCGAPTSSGSLLESHPTTPPTWIEMFPSLSYSYIYVHVIHMYLYICICTYIYNSSLFNL